MKLTETQRQTAINALRVAAARFAESALVFDAELRMKRLAEQFRRQEQESMELATYMEDQPDDE